MDLYGKHTQKEESGLEKVAPTFKGTDGGNLPMKYINKDPSQIVILHYLFSLPYMGRGRYTWLEITVSSLVWPCAMFWPVSCELK